MKKIYALVIFILILTSNLLFGSDLELAKTSLTGRVTDLRTGDALAGVIIYFPDLKIGTVTNKEGNYKIDNLPQSKVQIQVSFVGYRTILETIDLDVTSEENFKLDYVATEINEVVVTGLSKIGEQKRTPTPILVIPMLTLLQTSSTNIIDAISLQPGVSQITTGASVSKPVIRGLGYNRVVVINDGIRQEGQQWGDEHGIEIDESSINHVEILKGAASLVYGSDAMAGVVNLMSAPTLPMDKIGGSFSTNYQTNNGLIGYSGNLSGNKDGLIWDIRYSNKMAHSYQNRYDGYVFNSEFNENAANGLIGLNKSWGYSHLSLSIYNLTPGIVEGERDSLTGKFVKPIAINSTTNGVEIASNKDLKSYSSFTPYQKIHHYKVVWSNSFVAGDGNIKALLGFQQNQRQEYANILEPNNYGLYFLLNTLNYDFRYNLPEVKNLNISFGVNGMQQKSMNKGCEFLVPEYNLFDVGTFAIAKKTLGKFDISGGLRFDKRFEQSKDLYLDANGNRISNPDIGSTHRFAAFNSTFSGISGSIGATWQISKIVYTKFNLSRGYRAPNIGELSANGLHEGTNRYELGNPNLKAENSLQLDYTLGYNSEHISAELNLFDNRINNFIFLRKLNNSLGGDSITERNKTFNYVSGNAHLYGGEIRFDIHPHPYDWIHFENSFSYVRAIQSDQTDSTKNLPFTPAPKLNSTLKFEANKLGKFMRSAYVKVDVEYYFTQNKIYSAYGTETRTSGYTLFNFGIGTNFANNNKTYCSIYISVNNLTDVAYQSHLSRLKYEAMNYNTRRTGVYNMGRNISIKLILPIDLK